MAALPIQDRKLSLVAPLAVAGPAREWDEDVSLDRIVLQQRLRPISPPVVEGLRTSYRESGWFGRILLRPLTIDGEEKLVLVIGAHRYVAAKLERFVTIKSTIRVMTDDEALQFEIDENLIRGGLTPLERAEMMLSRFEIWARRFPHLVAQDGDAAKPKRGRPEKGLNMSQFLAGSPETMGFADATAAEIGLSKATIKRAWQTVNGLPAPLRNRLHGTWLAKNDATLRQLAAIADPAEQAKVADVLLAGEIRKVPDAVAIASGNAPVKPAQTPVDDGLKAFRAMWGKASPSLRVAILDDLAGRALPKGWTLQAPEADRG